jgi:hypothetical protein
MLNYLGPSMGPQGPVSASLPPAVAGTMPAGIPGVTPSPAPMPPIQFHQHGGLTGAPPAALAAIMKHNPGGPTAPPPPPPPSEYDVTTQADGSLLLHIRNPDGSLGPVVKVIGPVKALGDHPSNPAGQDKK